MANAIETVAARLLATTALTALVSTRIFPNKPKEEAAFPYLTFWRQGGGDGANLGGNRGLKQHEIRIEVKADTQDESAEVLEAAFGGLHGWRDSASGVQGCFAVGDADERLEDDGTQVSGQSFTLHYCPQ